MATCNNSAQKHASGARRTGAITWLRWAIQLGFFAFVAYVAVRHQIVGGGPTGSPSMEAYCPFGGLESAWKYLTTGQFLNRITSSTLIITLALVATTIVGKSAFCGWICPLGAVQEWIGALGKRLFGRQFALPKAVDGPAQLLRYVVLIWAVVASAIYGTLVFRDYDPFIALAHYFTFEALTANAILVLVLVASLFADRPWCRYFCPLGAFVGLLGRISIFKIERDATICRNCRVCNKACNAGVDVARATRIADDACIGCLACTQVCPVKGTLALRPPRLAALNPVRDVALDARRYTYVAGLLVVFFVVVLGAQAGGLWIEKQGVDAAGRTVDVSAMNVEEIKGWMKVGETVTAHGVPLSEVYERFGIPADVSLDQTFKEMGSVVKGFSADEFRAWLKERQAANK